LRMKSTLEILWEVNERWAETVAGKLLLPVINKGPFPGSPIGFNNKEYKG
jgi:hypothetical protein